MQQTAELDAAANGVDVQSSRKRKAFARRKVTVRLSERLCGQLDVATDRPGVGKSMLVEAAIEHFLNPAPSVEALLDERFDDLHVRFDNLEHDMRMIAETVSLHARYHLAVVPPLPPSQQRQAAIVGDERFKILAAEIAVMLLGSSISFAAIVASGPELLAGIAVTVVVALAASYATSRALGLPQRISILIACGNSICGNSAIAAVAPIIGADSDEVASSIAFTAILGVVVVLALPLLIPLLALSESQYGVLAGLTVYAVPQVLAATVPISPLSAQLGTMVKLVRVLMLGPVVVLLSLLLPNVNICARRPPTLKRRHLVPWFILGFLALATLRAIGLVPQAMQGQWQLSRAG
jgi:uncharacterized membrane protein YadS